MPKARPVRPKAKSSKINTESPTSFAHSRRLKQPNYRSFKFSKRIKRSQKLPGSFKIFKQAIKTISHNWQLFLTITIIYGLLTLVLVRGIGGSLNLSTLKDTLKTGFGGRYASLFSGVTLFGYLIGSAGSSASAGGSVYQSMLIIFMSLVAIWTLRQVMAGHEITARDAFYKSAYPLVPFILVLIVIGLQLLPLAIGSWIYSTVITNGIAVTGLEKFIWANTALLLAILSLYMLCSSLFALYIVALPDMSPLKALRSARGLVLNRRWSLLRKIIFLPAALLIIGAIIMMPLIIYATAVAEWVFFFLSMFTLVVVHAYMYTLYRELL